MSWLSEFKRWFSGGKFDPTLEAKLVAVARAAAEARGWPWEEPIDITAGTAAGQRTWCLRSNAQSRGRNVVVTIREVDLAVLHAGYLPR